MHTDTVPDLLVVGHVCHDKLPDGTYTLGGAVAYCGLQAQRLGYHVAAITSFGPDFQFAGLFQDMEMKVVPAARTTVFENIYQDGARSQYLHARAADLVCEPTSFKYWQSKAALLCPIADEVSFDFIQFLSGKTITCVCPQGWMRRWDGNGKVFRKLLNNWEFITTADIVCMSENDVDQDWDLIVSIGRAANLLIVTQGAGGATVFQKGMTSHFPSFPTREVDPTGAGDVFAAAFTLKFSETRLLGDAMAYAHATASLRVEGKGVQALPTAKAVEKRYLEYLSKI
ncbi:MAG: hypothetical protein H6577_25580 [Lewinellaceae bacterium]|nr:hypothetical protein [Saprospiraceae bacterium]MCB9341508.1 hypothetical protein [Lewinellaceae bacterium]